ncbi:hypothetical protein [Streptomyces sp. 2131.1]|uniref:ATP-dependent DNA ligase n=1 Tax=Streptomyces sp. 2131.1 TaxID=1855346 RepID=UPI00210C7503|nr:hypothetical protein [Streptomyces sp. 2131.1]
MTLNPPLEPMLAQARDAIPRPGPGGAAAELKFDRYRALLFTPDVQGGRVLVQSRHGTMLQSRFPDLVSAAGQLPSGLVLDGELVVLDENGHLSFPALQRRAATVAVLRLLPPPCRRTSSPSTSSRSRAASCWTSRTPPAGPSWRACSWSTG